MSCGSVQTLPADATPGDVACRFQRPGQGCWPVMQEEKVVGLLHYRDLDRALQHCPGSLSIRDIMQTEGVSLLENDDFRTLEERLATPGQDCVAVVDANGHLRGMVSRGDLLRFRVDAIGADRTLSSLDTRHAPLIAEIAEAARQIGTALWLVGGTVRDLLLGLPADDIDFVVEGPPQGIARAVKSRLGGKLGPPTPFGTIRWTPAEGVAALPDHTPDDLPVHVDFAAARAETYSRPAALPDVRCSTLHQDLGRRDFAINALAIPVAPEPGPVIDPLGGLADLCAGRIRVLHNQSFHDDPLRILRAWRFRARFGFDIDGHTAELVQAALPVLGQITGTRLRNELELVLQEDDPGGILHAMQENGILRAMHPAFQVRTDIAEQFARLLQPAELAPPPLLKSLWHALAAGIAADALPSFCDRLQFPPGLAASMLAANLLARDPGPLAQESASTLQIVKRLERVPRDAAWCVWRLTESALVRERLLAWLTRWPGAQTCCNGHDVLAAGLSPGPVVARILLRLRIAWYDGDINTEAEERALLARLVAAEEGNGAGDDAES